MKLIITPSTLQNLRTLQVENKFVEENLYPGAPNESTRSRCEIWINELLDELMANVEYHPQKSFVINEFMKALGNFENEDTEEREQACGYLEQIMAILGIESSDGVLSKWLYGFDPDET